MLVKGPRDVGKGPRDVGKSPRDVGHFTTTKLSGPIGMKINGLN